MRFAASNEAMNASSADAQPQTETSTVPPWRARQRTVYP
jgi:hypothetical protein